MNSEFDPVEPTQRQIDNCAMMGWVYTGDGIFEKNGVIGWFTKHHGFQKT